MKILFSPTYDSGYYMKLDGTAPKIGTKVVGIKGLLEHLCLHNGLSGLFVSDGERASAYLSHVAKKANGTMIQASFANDALGVTKCLLNWRDNLIMAGWNPSQGGDASTPKLKLLSRIEESWAAQLKGSADRWSELAALSKQQHLISDGDTIECRCSMESLPRLVQDVLVSCKASFMEYPADVSLLDSAKIKILHYNDLSDAYRQMAVHIEEYKNTVVINRDNVSLNHILFARSLPLLGATIQDSNPLTLQLFKLAMSVFSRPLNIHNILSYLQLPIGPVPGKLRHALAKILIAEGGFGAIDWNELDDSKANELRKAGFSTKWELAIYDYINEEDETISETEKLTKTKRKSKTRFLEYITNQTLDKNKIPVEQLKQYISDFNKWASGLAISTEEEDEMLASQLATVVSYFKQLSDALGVNEVISYQELEKLVRTIYQPTSIVQACAQVGSLNVIENYSQILDTPDNLLWLDCCGADQYADRYEFLSAAECTWLSGRVNVTIPKLQDVLIQNRKEMITVLSRIKGKITLVTADYHHNQKMAEHPLIAELKMQFGASLNIVEGDTSLPLSAPQDARKIEPKPMYEIGNTVYNGRSESNTSIDTIINYPFDYTVQYVAKLNKPSNNELGSIQKNSGLVAHSLIAELVADAKNAKPQDVIAEMVTLLNHEYNDRFEKAVMITGLSLLLKENEVDYNNLKFQLRRSIEVLIYIMKVKKLKPIGCEMKHDSPIGKVIRDFNARVDMELEDENQNTVIFDFKWSFSKSYGEKIKEGKALQLELYRQELKEQGKNVSAVGYYLLPKCVLETPDYDTLKDTNGKDVISHIDPPGSADLFAQIEESFKHRKDEINEGHIEEGEEMDIKDLPYSTALINGANMLLVGNVKKTKITKANPTATITSIEKESNRVYTTKPETRFSRSFVNFSDSNTPANEKPTTYPLMKGRLK